MPYSLTFESDLEFSRRVFTGTISALDLMSAAREEAADPRFRPGMNVLCDLREARVEANYEQMLQYVTMVEEGPRIGKHAVVVARDLEYGLARMFESLTESRGSVWKDLKIFYELDAAEAWIRTR